ncbi:GFA family protein [Kaustia mangrovi]|uniref:GFA family protein n=1 Tax=Kaustia mangrovi TaxID=2593653 RepID=A0A7S8C5K8_9HYPH|nr:GFA family protein [Kaustia mangrovi]QPC43803.1 GFA family protein [Kaustia mangrovi]
MPEETTFKGGCHCGAVRFEITTDLGTVMNCNCSHCAMRGVLWNFAPETRFALTQGEDALQDYQFNKKVIHHLFCRTCGVESFARGTMPDGTPTVAVNVRCLDGIDLESLTLTPIDGRSK